MGQHGRVALPRAAGTSAGDGGFQRGATGRTGHAGQHDRRHRGQSTGERVMNGAHDMGGMHGMGPIDTDPNDPLFHAEWEKRAFAITLALGFHGRWNIDMARHARENRHPLDYLGSSYYELWLKGVERLAVDTGMISAEELATGEP